jgi:hypothetical protein
MSQTLLILYPANVEEFFSYVRGLVNFDFFSIPALGCVIGTPSVNSTSYQVPLL